MCSLPCAPPILAYTEKKMRPLPTLLVLTTFSLPTATTHAQLGELGNDISSGYGIVASANTRIGFEVDLAASAFNGGEFIGNASASETTFGTARASGIYQSSTDLLPELKAFATTTSTDDDGNTDRSAAGAGVTGLQAYLYEGQEEKTFTISYALDAVLTPNGDFGASTSFDILVWSNLNPSFVTDTGTLLSQTDLTFQPSLQEASDFTSDPGENVFAGEFSITLQPNDSLWVYAGIDVNAGFGAIADAESTFTATFTNPGGAAGLTASGVPEPANAALIALGSLALIGRRRHTT